MRLTSAMLVGALPAGAASLACVLTGCGAQGSAAGATAGAPPSILIVVVDAMRPDHLGCYGYDRTTAPAIDALARDPDAVSFRHHYVQGAYTKSSTASLFTGLYVFQHGVVIGHEMHENPQRPGMFPVQLLRDDLETIAERIRHAGHRTFGVVKSHHLDPKYGFAQGFDEYYKALDIRSDGERARKVVELAAAPGPYFGYVHLAGCHHPFPPPSRHPGFMEEYAHAAGLKYDEWARMEQGVNFNIAETQHAINDGRLDLDADDVRFLNLIYDAELRHSDDHVRTIIEGLKASGRYGDTLLIVTADHGEELYEHGGYGHGHALWDEVIHVPLIVKFPRGAKPASLPREVAARTQAIDLAPALLSLAGIEIGGDLPGTDIFHGAGPAFAYAETLDEWALIQDNFKIITGAQATRLFDLAADPGEQADLADAQAERVEAMRTAAAALWKHVTIRPGEAPTGETELSAEEIRALRSLGYIR